MINPFCDLPDYMQPGYFDWNLDPLDWYEAYYWLTP